MKASKKATRHYWVSSTENVGHLAPTWLGTLTMRARTRCGVIIPSTWSATSAMTVDAARKFFVRTCPRCVASLKGPSR